MKLSVTFKDPDVVHEALFDAELALVKKLMVDLGLTREGAVAEAEARMQNMRKLIQQFMEYGEYATITFDDEERTAIVERV